MTSSLVTMLYLALAVAAAVLSRCAVARDTLYPGAPLSDNDTLVSAGGLFSLGFFSPPGTANRYVAVWYNAASFLDRRSVVWIMNRSNPVTNASAGAALSMRNDGTLVITDAAKRTVYSWPEGISGNGSATAAAQLLDSGNFVAGGGDLWQSFDYPTDTIIAGMRLGEDRATGKNWTLTAWKSDSDPAPSDVVFVLDVSGDPEMFLYAGGRKVWRSGPWDGVRFSGVQIYDGPTFVNSGGGTTYMTYKSNQTVGAELTSMLRANYSGELQRWVVVNGGWAEYWHAPNDACDVIGSCGLNGVCASDSQLVSCSCPPGFSPRNATEWKAMVWRGGCLRDTPLSCAGAGDDGFAMISRMKVPDTTRSVVDAGVPGIDECKNECLKNCSCTAVAVADISSGRGCVMWFGELDDMRVYASAVDGQDFFVRLAGVGGAPSESHGNGDTPVALVVSLTVGITALLAGGAYCYYRKVYRKKKVVHELSTKRSSKAFSDQEDDVDLPLLDLETIANATDEFSTANKIGEGGFGPVYWGKLADGQEIAIKRLAKRSLQGNAEFKNEVRLIAKLQHRHLVRLIGCCIEDDERILVYEFVPNRSLDAYLFGERSSTILDWRTRYRIINGVARGLLYLHEDSRLRVIHRDLKASNILLDENMNPKISDFGMARIFGGDCEAAMFNTRRVVGTYGYMSPEYVMRGAFSVKSDVFSYGVLVLEIISGKRNGATHARFSDDYTSLLSHAWSLWNDRKALEFVDESLDPSDYSAQEVLKCLKLGLLCVQADATDRPLMSAAVLMLSSHDVSALPEPKQPGFIAMTSHPGRAENPTSSSAMSGADTITILIEGR